MIDISKIWLYFGTESPPMISNTNHSIAEPDTKLQSTIDVLNSEAWALCRTNPARANELAAESLELSKQAGYGKGIAYATGITGASYTWLSEYDKALDYTAKSVELLLECREHRFAVQMLYIIGVIYHYIGDYDKQLEYCYQSYTLAESIDDTGGMANALNGIGTVQYSIGENEKAIDSLSRALILAEQEQAEGLIPRILDGLGVAHSNIGKYPEALSFMSKALVLLEKQNIAHTLSYVHSGIGDIHLRQGDYEAAIESFNKALSIRREMHFKGGEADSLYDIGKVHFRVGDFIKARSFMTQALEIATGIDAKEIQYKVHFSLSEVYEQMGNMRAFAEHFRMYHTLKEEYSRETNKKKVQTLELESELAQMKREKALLDEQRMMLEKHRRDMEVLEDMGRELLSTLDMEGILNKLYEKANSIMDAAVFAIGIYNEASQCIDMEFVVEKGERMPVVALPMDPASTRLGIWVAIHKQEAILNDVRNDIKNYFGGDGYSAYAGEVPESIIYLPLLIHDKLVGIISVQSFAKNAYSEYQISLLKNIANYASGAIENANLFKNLEIKVQERTKEVQLQKEEIENNQKTTILLSEIGQQLISSLDLNVVFDYLHSNVNQLMDATIFGIRLYDETKQEILYKYEIENSDRHPEVAVSMNKKNNYSVWCVENKQSIHINNNLEEYSKYVNEIMVVSGELPHSLLFQPLMKGDTVLGVITVQSFQRNAYTNHHLNILRTLAGYTVIAIENAGIYETLEKKVSERTADINRLSAIGQQIISQLSIERINRVIYDNLSAMMDAPSFGIGVYNEKTETLSFPGYIEEGELLTGSTFHISELNRIAVACFTRELEILIGNFADEHTRYVKEMQLPKAGKAVTSLMYLPLKIKDRKVGVITVQSFKENSFTEYHFNILKNLAAYAAIAIENAQLYESLEERVEQRTCELQRSKEEIEQNQKNTELLSLIGKDITSSLSIPEIIERVHININQILKADCFGIGIYEPEQNRILMPGFYENGKRMEDYWYNCDEERLAVICFTQNRELVINNYFDEYSQYIKTLISPVSGSDSASIIYLPVYSKEKIIGVITAQSFTPNMYNDYHVNFMRNLAVYVGIALENATLYLNMEEKVIERTKEVTLQKEIIEEKNKSITDSIKYAKRIQDATLPDTTKILSTFQDAFVLFKPKDIVSGDFYWMQEIQEETGRKVLFAVVDCTGHGVPGAFMSIIGHNALNQIVKEYGITKPSEALFKLNEIVKSTLDNQLSDSHIQIKDGMDIALCCYHEENRTLEFAGAFNPLYFLRGDKIEELKGDIIAIGNSQKLENSPYANHLIQLEKNDCIYIFSDGYADQFGGPRGKKFKYERFQEILLKNKHLPMVEQRNMLESELEAWRGDIEQIDDVCVLGLRVA